MSRSRPTLWASSIDLGRRSVWIGGPGRRRQASKRPCRGTSGCQGWHPERAQEGPHACRRPPEVKLAVLLHRLMARLGSRLDTGRMHEVELCNIATTGGLRLRRLFPHAEECLVDRRPGLRPAPRVCVQGLRRRSRALRSDDGRQVVRLGPLGERLPREGGRGPGAAQGADARGSGDLRRQARRRPLAAGVGRCLAVTVE